MEDSERKKVQSEIKWSKKDNIIYWLIAGLSLRVLKFGWATTYDLTILIIDLLFFIILMPYVIAIKTLLVSKKMKKETKNKNKSRLSFKAISKAINIYGRKKFIKFIVMLLIPIILFIFLLFVVIKINYKANINKFEEIVSTKCPLISDNIHNLENVKETLTTDINICGYEIGFIIINKGDTTTYPKMLNYIKYETTPYVPGGRSYNLFHKEYTTIDSYHYKSIYKNGNNIVYAIAPMDKKDEALWLIRELGYTSIPSFDNIFN